MSAAPKIPQEILERAANLVHRQSQRRSSTLRAEPGETSAEDRDELPRARVVTLDTVEPEHVTWLWPGYLPLGKLTILEGDPGLGKSTLSLAIAAAVSRGIALPGGSATPPADVVVVTYEDGLADTIRPRLDAAGADLRRVHAIQGITTVDSVDRLVSFPSDGAAVFEVVKQCGAKLVIIDPLSAALSRATDTYKDADVRLALAPLARMAEESGACVQVVRHLNKAAKVRAIAAGGGSIGIAAAARSVLAVHPDPEAPDTRRILAVVKNNLAAIAPSLAFALAARENGCAAIEWGGVVPHSAESLTALRADDAAEEAGSRREVEEWLASALTAAPVERKQVKAQAESAGFSWRSVERASERLGVIKKLQGFGSNKTSVWSIAPILANPATPSHTGGHGAYGGNEGVVV